LPRQQLIIFDTFAQGSDVILQRPCPPSDVNSLLSVLNDILQAYAANRTAVARLLLNHP
jgi:hypothetical protein